MTPPINIDGSTVDAITIDGTSVSEVTVDGSTVFRPIPDSAVNHAVAADYDGSKWVSDIGPNLPDEGGDPVQKTKTYRNQSVEVVEYTDGSDYSQNSLAVDGSYCFIYVAAVRKPDASDFHRFMDGGSPDSFSHFKRDNDTHKIATNSFNVTGTDGEVDGDLNVYALEIVGDGTGEFRLFENGTSSPIISADANSVESLSGFTLNAKAGGNDIAPHDYAEVTVLEDHPAEDRDAEVSRLLTKYNI